MPRPVPLLGPLIAMMTSIAIGAEGDVAGVLARKPIDEPMLRSLCDADAAACVNDAFSYVIRKAPPDDRGACVVAVMAAVSQVHSPAVVRWFLDHPRGDVAILVNTGMTPPRRDAHARAVALDLFASTTDQVVAGASEDEQRLTAAQLVEHLVRLGRRPSQDSIRIIKGWLADGRLPDPQTIVGICRTGILNSSDHTDGAIAGLKPGDSRSVDALAALSTFSCDPAILDAAERRLLPQRQLDPSLLPYFAVGHPTPALVADVVTMELEHPRSEHAEALVRPAASAVRRCSAEQMAPVRPRLAGIKGADLIQVLPLVRAVAEVVRDQDALHQVTDAVLQQFLAAPADLADGVVLEVALGDVQVGEDLVGALWDLLGDKAKRESVKPLNRAGLVSLLVRGLDAKSIQDDQRRAALMREAGAQTAGYGMNVVRYLSVTKGFIPHEAYLKKYAATDTGKAALLALTPGWRESQQAMTPTVDIDALWTSPLVTDGAVWALRHLAARDVVDVAVVRKWLASRYPESEGDVVRRLILERFGEAVPGVDPLSPAEVAKADERSYLALFELALARQRLDVASAVVDEVAKRLRPESATLWVLRTVAGLETTPPSLTADELAGPLLPQAADLLVTHHAAFTGRTHEVRAIPQPAPTESDGVMLENLLRWRAAIDALPVD